MDACRLRTVRRGARRRCALRHVRGSCARRTVWYRARAKGSGIPLFIDIHELTGATPEEIANAHVKDVAIQGNYGVSYVKYWLNETRGKVFCLCTAPSAEAAEQVHRDAHGLVAERIIEVDPDLAEGMLGGGTVALTGAAILGPGGKLDPGLRTILFTDIVGSTELTQRLGDRAAMDILDLHDGLVREALGRTRGREVKHLGDGLMGVFVSADDAIRCALEAHAAFARCCPPHRRANPHPHRRSGRRAHRAQR